MAVTVSVMGFGSVVESYSCANPISGLLRVYFSHTRRADRGNGEGFSIAGKQISPRDRYRSLLSRDKRSPRVPPVYFIPSLSPFLLARSPRFSPDIFCSKYESTPTYLHLPLDPLSLFFSPRHIFLRSTPTQTGTGKGTTGLVEGVP